MFRKSTIVLAFVLAAACAQPVDVEAVRAEITAESDKFNAAITSGKPLDAVKFYETDGESVTPTEIFKGHVRIGELFKDTPSGMKLTSKRSGITVSASGDMALERGVFSSEIDGQSGSSSEYVTAWRKGADGWKIQQDWSFPQTTPVEATPENIPMIETEEVIEEPPPPPPPL